ncbi:hypothetical protein NP233_g7667 [Leucocoprinus birnbaumii]|uniref:CHAT domain-containing protein n=1 Tax=Leucocoprinus birnbaumii TaxID=56174 RepID=A0AAD5VQD5_9AGAR|nr:hypothetical protein NP233_g7667 [Leucocoprinus birnbaumii]
MRGLEDVVITSQNALKLLYNKVLIVKTNSAVVPVVLAVLLKQTAFRVSLMDDNAEIEQLARDMTRVKVELFENYVRTAFSVKGCGLTSCRYPSRMRTKQQNLIFLVWHYRRLIQEYQTTHSFEERDWRYGDLALRLACFLATRFYLARKKERSDLQEAKELEVIICRYNHNIQNGTHDDHHDWSMYKWFIARAELMVEYQKMDARLTQLQIQQAAQSLLSSHQIEALASLMDEKAEPEQLARDMASVKVRLFRDSNIDPYKHDALIMAQRHMIQLYQAPSRIVKRDRTKYGHVVLNLAVHLVSRFSTARRKESIDLQESKELETIISRNNRDINNKIHGDYHEWQNYKWLIARADLIVAFEKLEARLALLQAHQAQPLYLSHQTETSTLLHTEPPVATLEANAEVPCRSNTTNSLVVVMDIDHNLIPSSSRPDSSQPTSPQSIPINEAASLNSWMKALHNANNETEIRDYAIYCQALAQFHFSRYRMAKGALDLEEAAEYSVTAYQLFADVADVSLSLISRTMAILLAYLAEHLGNFPQLPSLNILETFKQLIDHFPETTDTPGALTLALTLPQTKPPVTTPELNSLGPFPSNATSSLAAITDTDDDLIPSSAQFDPSQPSSFPPSIPSNESTTMNLLMSALHNANDETDIIAYATYCRVLAHCFFSRYQVGKDALDLEEAAEYSVTAYRLFASNADAFLGLILPRTIAVLLAYRAEYMGESSPLRSTNVFEAYQDLIDHSSKTTDPPETSTSALPHPRLDCLQPSFIYRRTIPSSRSTAMILTMSALRDANDETDIISYATYCHILAHFSFSRYRLKKDIHDLEEAAEYSVTAYRLFEDTAPEFLGGLILHRTIDIMARCLDTYGHCDVILPPSINVVEALVTLINDPSFGPRQPDAYIARLNLGSIVRKAYYRTKNPLYAEMAIAQYKEVVEYQPRNLGLEGWEGHRWREHCHLAQMLIDRYQRSGDASDIDIALNNLHLVEEQMYHPAIEGPLGQVWHPIVKSLLGLVSWIRFFGRADARVSMEDKERAISYYQSPETYSAMPVPYFLGGMLIRSYQQYRNRTDLDRGIQFLEEQLQHDSVPHHKVFLELANAYTYRQAEGDDIRTFRCFKAVAEADRRNTRNTAGVDEYTSEMSPKTRGEWRRYATRPFHDQSVQFRSACAWGNLALEQDHPECVEAFALAASVLPELVGIGNTIEDVHKKLRVTQNFAVRAAAAAVKFSTSSLAVEWLEQSMSVTTRQIYQLRLDVGSLETRYPDHFETLKTLSEGLRQLSGEPVPTSGPSAFVGTNKGRIRLAYEACIEEIRRKPGMENFLRPLCFPQLAEAARHGPVILLSCDHVTEKTYAFIALDPSVEEPIALPLPGASFEEIDKLGDGFQLLLIRHKLNVYHRSPEDDSESRHGRSGRVSNKGGRDKESEQFEAWLNEIWMRIVKPVFDELEKHGIKSGRVWWCPAGRLEAYPFHAAVPIDCPFISSYTYGLEVLVNARARLGNTSSERSKPSSSRFSIVGISDYPGLPRLALPAVAQEVQIVSDLVEGSAGIALHKMENHEASVDAVLSTLRSSQFIHLACHGYMDIDDPLDSHLVLSNGHLDLRRILAEDLTTAEFAFLSACQTAVGASALRDESVHLAGGFVAAGFKGVIGTLWRINDDDAPGVVKDVYETMRTEEGLDITMAADGLDWAVKRMRKAGVPPHRWVPFIHVGV